MMLYTVVSYSICTKMLTFQNSPAAAAAVAAAGGTWVAAACIAVAAAADKFAGIAVVAAGEVCCRVLHVPL